MPTMWCSTFIPCGLHIPTMRVPHSRIEEPRMRERRSHVSAEASKQNLTDQERALAVTRQGCQPGIDDRHSGVIPHTRPGRWHWRSSQGLRQALPVSASPVWEGLVWEARQRMATAWPPRCLAPCRRCPEDAPLRPQWSGGRRQRGWPRHIDWDGVSLLSS